MKKIALITGATSGIGQATAKLLAKNDFDVIITGRRNKRLEQLEEEIIKSQSTNVYTLNFDVRNKTEVEDAINSLPDEWKNISVLINNAGLASGLDPVQDGNYDDWEKMIDTNVKGLLYVSRVVSKIMVENKSGHISSIAAAKLILMAEFIAAQNMPLKPLPKACGSICSHITLKLAV
jgi:hypothetical protein